jgi:hypothetical protein
VSLTIIEPFADRHRAIKFSANDSSTSLYQSVFSMPTLTQSVAFLTETSAGAMKSPVVIHVELLKIRLQHKTSAKIQRALRGWRFVGGVLSRAGLAKCSSTCAGVNSVV